MKTKIRKNIKLIFNDLSLSNIDNYFKNFIIFMLRIFIHLDKI